MGKRVVKPIALVLVRHGRDLKHESFADLLSFNSTHAEIKWHVASWKNTVPLGTVFVIRNDEPESISLKELVEKGVFKVDSDESNGQKVMNAKVEDEVDENIKESYVPILNQGKRKRIKTKRYSDSLFVKEEEVSASSDDHDLVKHKKNVKRNQEQRDRMKTDRYCDSPSVRKEKVYTSANQQDIVKRPRGRPRKNPVSVSANKDTLSCSSTTKDVTPICENYHLTNEVIQSVNDIPICEDSQVLFWCISCNERFEIEAEALNCCT